MSSRPNFKRPNFNRQFGGKGAVMAFQQAVNRSAAYSRLRPRQLFPQRRAPVRDAKEKGFVDVAVANKAADTTGTIALYNTVAQGAGTSQRIGKKFKMTSIQIKGSVSAGTAAVLNDIACILIYDKRPTGSLPAITDILDTATSRSFNNDANAGRFQTIRRWDWTLSGNSTTTATGAEIRGFDKFVKLNHMVVCKAAGTGAIGDIEEGALYMVTVGNQAAGTSAANISFGTRVRYVDV